MNLELWLLANTFVYICIFSFRMWAKSSTKIARNCHPHACHMDFFHYFALIHHKLHTSRWISLGFVFALRDTLGCRRATRITQLYLNYWVWIKLINLNHLHESLPGKCMYLMFPPPSFFHYSFTSNFFSTKTWSQKRLASLRKEET